jgi:hypothetical protein
LKSGSPHSAIEIDTLEPRMTTASADTTAISDHEAQDSVPGSGEPIFQAAAANFNPWTEAKVDTKNPERGPLLITTGAS